MSEKKRILITGSQGFIGRALTLPLQKAGYEVWGIDLSGTSEDSHTIHADLLDLQKTINALETVPLFMALIHTAALAHGQCPPKGESCVTINTRITDNILQAAGEKIERLIFFSSVAVYGEDGHSTPVSVTDQLHPSTDYGRSKLRCEESILKSTLEHCDMLRLAPVYDENHMNDVRKRVFIPGLSSIKMRLSPPPDYSLCHINTVIQTIMDLLAHLPNGKRVFNVADSKLYNQLELASWFPGKGIALPINFFLPFYWLAGLLPGERGYSLRCLYWKLFRSNVYMANVSTI